MLVSLGSSLHAQNTTLRMGLTKDADILDQTLARTYVAASCSPGGGQSCSTSDDKPQNRPQWRLSKETPPTAKPERSKRAAG